MPIVRAEPSLLNAGSRPTPLSITRHYCSTIVMSAPCAIDQHVGLTCQKTHRHAMMIPAAPRRQHSLLRMRCMMSQLAVGAFLQTCIVALRRRWERGMSWNCRSHSFIQFADACLQRSMLVVFQALLPSTAETLLLQYRSSSLADLSVRTKHRSYPAMAVRSVQTFRSRVFRL